MAFKSSGNGNGGGAPLPPRENVAFQVVSYNVKDRNKASAEDTFDAVLLTEAFGQPAGTQLTFRQPLMQGKVPEKGASVQNMRYGQKPLIQPTEIEGQGIAEGAYLDRRSGQVVMNWLTIKVHKPNSADQLLFGQYFGVDTERKSDNGYVSQARYMYDVSSAHRVSAVDKDALLAVIKDHLETPASQLGGDPGFVLRGIDLDRYSEEAFEATRMTLSRIEDAAAPGGYRNATPDEAIERFTENRYYKQFVDHLMDPNDPVANPLIEVIPMVRLRTGQMSLPSNGKTRDDGTPARDDSRWFKIPLNPEETDNDKKRYGHMVARGHAHISWKEGGEGQEGSYFSTLTLPMTRQAPLFALAEIPTHNLPQEIYEFFAARAAENGVKADPPRTYAPRTPAAAPAESTGGPRP